MGEALDRPFQGPSELDLEPVHDGEPHAQAVGAEIAIIRTDEAYDRVQANDVRYRFVIDTATVWLATRSHG